MKREFPFGWALFLALLVHTIVGIVLKQNPLLIAATPPLRGSAPPVQMRFVESPPNAKVAEPNRQATHLSDANRKAGPLIRTEKRDPRSTQYSQPRPKSQSNQRTTERASRSEASALPQIEKAPIQQPDRGDYRTPSSGTDQRRLSESLKNLDQFIGSGNGDSAQGDQPSGDPGSGVFFDTQGFDLGPWANRVVAIVRSNWIVPVAAQLGVKGIVGVAFQVERNGTIVNARVISESGTPSFDQAALNALKTSSPLPPLPAEFPRQALPGVFRFYYNMPVPDK
jgi:TonB family protein